MAATSETKQPLPEPELPQSDVSDSAGKIMATLEASLVKIPAVREYMDSLGVGDTLPDNHAFEHNAMAVQFLKETDRDSESNSKRMSLVISYADPEDHNHLNILWLNLFSCTVDRNPEMPTGKIETTFDGVKSKNTRTAVQNAQRFITLLS